MMYIHLAELLLGLIALLLTTFQDRLGKICITEKQGSQWLPCKTQDMSTSTTAPRYCSEVLFALFHFIDYTYCQYPICN